MNEFPRLAALTPVETQFKVCRRDIKANREGLGNALRFCRVNPCWGSAPFHVIRLFLGTVPHLEGSAPGKVSLRGGVENREFMGAVEQPLHRFPGEAEFTRPHALQVLVKQHLSLGVKDADMDQVAGRSTGFHFKGKGPAFLAHGFKVDDGSLWRPLDVQRAGLCSGARLGGLNRLLGGRGLGAFLGAGWSRPRFLSGIGWVVVEEQERERGVQHFASFPAPHQVKAVGLVDFQAQGRRGNGFLSISPEHQHGFDEGTLPLKLLDGYGEVVGFAFPSLGVHEGGSPLKGSALRAWLLVGREQAQEHGFSRR